LTRPASELRGPCRTRGVALVEGLEGSRPGAVKLHELLVVALESLSWRSQSDLGLSSTRRRAARRAELRWRAPPQCSE
jgi:hypothetical protein